MLSFQSKEKNLEILMEYDASIPEPLLIDPLRLQQVLLNLVGNAVKFTHEGTVTIRLYRIDDPKNTASVVVHCEVKDTGIGIGPEDCKKIFMEFEQGDPSTTRKYGGAGLGLAIAKEILHLMGSELRVKSEPNVGSTFYFDLVVKQISKYHKMLQKTPFRENVDALPKIQRKIKALLVEDEPINMLLTKKLLQKIHPEAEILEASNGEEALQIFLKHKPDIIFMDIQMPLMDGYSATVRIRSFESREGGHRPIIALTAAADKYSISDCHASGMDDVLVKPLSIFVFEKVYRKWVQSDPATGY